MSTVLAILDVLLVSTLVLTALGALSSRDLFKAVALFVAFQKKFTASDLGSGVKG